jgi:hypothetical protein
MTWLESAADAALSELRRAAGTDPLPGVTGHDLLGERAAELGRWPAGQTSANGSCHLLRAADGWFALNLARDEDAALLPAWLCERDVGADVADLARRVASRSARELVARGRLLGLPIAAVADTAASANAWTRVHTSRCAGGHERWSVADLSGLWAGPLCGHVLARSGAGVIKVESADRHDAARDATPRHFARLNAGKEHVAIDFRSARGMRELRALVDAADVVIESARPRALRQLGIDSEALVRARPGKVWISITGYGRASPQRDWVAFGDDAAVAAGAVDWTCDGPAFCGDAVADPLTGLHAGLAAMSCLRDGVGGLVELSLAGVTAHCLRDAMRDVGSQR